jgi:hypothetical protein
MLLHLEASDPASTTEYPLPSAADPGYSGGDDYYFASDMEGYARRPNLAVSSTLQQREGQ